MNLLPLEYIYSRSSLPNTGVVIASEFSTCSRYLSIYVSIYVSIYISIYVSMYVCIYLNLVLVVGIIY
jgi:hypothetical protein